MNPLIIKKQTSCRTPNLSKPYFVDWKLRDISLRDRACNTKLQPSQHGLVPIWRQVICTHHDVLGISNVSEIYRRNLVNSTSFDVLAFCLAVSSWKLNQYTRFAYDWWTMSCHFQITTWNTKISLTRSYICTHTGDHKLHNFMITACVSHTCTRQKHNHEKIELIRLLINKINDL